MVHAVLERVRVKIGAGDQERFIMSPLGKCYEMRFIFETLEALTDVHALSARLGLSRHALAPQVRLEPLIFHFLFSAENNLLCRSRRKILRLYQRLRKDSIECLEFGDDTETEEEEEAEESTAAEGPALAMFPEVDTAEEAEVEGGFRGRLRDRRWARGC